jgi:Holliday junction resolvasome RuvABC DNA-binding subunit
MTSLPKQSVASDYDGEFVNNLKNWKANAKMDEPAKDAFERLVYLGYPQKRASKAVGKAVTAIIREGKSETFENIFRAAMIALR